MEERSVKPTRKICTACRLRGSRACPRSGRKDFPLKCFSFKPLLGFDPTDRPGQQELPLRTRREYVAPPRDPGIPEGKQAVSIDPPFERKGG